MSRYPWKPGEIESRPEIKDLKRSFIEMYLNAVALALLIACWWSIYKTYPKLNPGDAGLSIAVGAAITVTYFFMLILELVPPRYYNYPMKITEENARTQYGLARIFIAAVRVALMTGGLGFATKGPNSEPLLVAGGMLLVGTILLYVAVNSPSKP